MDVQEKYDLFLMIYEQGVKEYVPFYKVKEKGLKKNGLTENVKELKREKMTHGGKWKKKIGPGKEGSILTRKEWICKGKKRRRGDMKKKYSWQMQRRTKAVLLMKK